MLGWIECLKYFQGKSLKILCFCLVVKKKKKSQNNKGMTDMYTVVVMRRVGEQNSSLRSVKPPHQRGS